MTLSPERIEMLTILAKDKFSKEHLWADIIRCEVIPEGILVHYKGPQDTEQTMVMDLAGNILADTTFSSRKLFTLISATVEKITYTAQVLQPFISIFSQQNYDYDDYDYDYEEED